METVKWFDREFDFNLTAADYPKLLERLDSVPAVLVGTVIQLPEDVLTAKHKGKWSIKEHVGHLWLMEALWYTRINDIYKGVPELTVADLENEATKILDFNTYQIADLVCRYAMARDITLQHLGRLNAVEVTHTSMHPRLRCPMRMIDHLYFIAEHDQHHYDAIKFLAIL